MRLSCDPLPRGFSRRSLASSARPRVRLGWLAALAFGVSGLNALAADFFVDPTRGNDRNHGTADEPFATIAHAVSAARDTADDKAAPTIKLAPGLYVLSDKISIDPAAHPDRPAGCTIEATVMPGTKDWSPDKMPVIQSVSPDNSTEQFPHSVGFLVAADNVTIRGLKFLGNPHPSVTYYYPITKENEALRGLHVSQCYFISEKNAVAIQGGIWAHGPATTIERCIFYNCRNAILLFKNVGGFSVTHSLIYGANESAVWMGPIDSDFTFKNNVVTQCHYFWVRPDNSQPAYPFSDCLITENQAHTGYYTNSGLVPVGSDGDRHFSETNVTTSGHVTLVERTDEHVPPRYLHLTPESAGYALDAGVLPNDSK